MKVISKSSRTEKIPASAQDLIVSRIFNASRELVFKAWTDPKHVAQWWGPHGFTNPVCELDLRPGGVMLIHMRAPDGTVIPSRGIYHEIAAPERIVFTTHAFEDDAGTPQLEVLHTVTFTDLGGRTKLTLRAHVVRSTPEVIEALAGMEQGWVEALERLDQIFGA